MMYLFNSTEWCYIKRTTDNVLQILLRTDHLTCRGGYGFLFRSEFFFSDNTRVRIFILFVAHSAKFFPEFNIRFYDKNSESDFFFPPPKSEYFFQQHWESEYFVRKNHKSFLLKHFGLFSYSLSMGRPFKDILMGFSSIRILS